MLVRAASIFKRHLLAMAVFAVLVAVLAFTRFAGDLPPPALHDLDIREYYVPNLLFVQARLGDGELPLWNSWRLAGYPFAATLQTGVYYPLLTPFLVWPVHVALSIHLLLHLWLTACIAYAGAKRLGLATPSAVGVGGVWVLSAPIFGAIYNPAMLSTLTWAPAILWSVDGLARKPDDRRTALLAVALSMGFLGGHPQLFAYAACAGVLLAVWSCAVLPGIGNRLVVVYRLVLAAGLAACLVGVQALPTLELVSMALRDFDTLDASRLTPLTPASALSFRPGGHLVGLPWLVWPLGAIAIVASRGKLRLLAIFLALLLFLAIDAMQGNQGVTFELWSRVPFLTLFRFPERFSMLAAMAGASLIGVGLEGIARTIPSAKVRLAASIVILTVAIVDSWTLNVPPYFYRPLAEPETLVRSSGIQDFSGSRNDSGRYFFENFYQSREAPKPVLDTSELPVMDAYEPLLPAVYADVFDAGQGDFWTGRLTVLEVRHPDLKKMYRQQSLRLMDVFGVRYYIDPKSMMEAPNHHLAEAMRDERRIDSTGIRMWERTSALPRAWIVHAARYVPTVKSAVSILRDDSFDPRHEVVLVYGPHSDGISLMDRAAPTTAGDQSRHESKSSVRLEFMKNEDVVVSADTDRPGILILSELWYPGWTATINGDPSEILRANGIFRAVRVPPGHHRVEFRYLPTSHRLGLAATVLGILVLIALLLRPASRRA